MPRASFGRSRIGRRGRSRKGRMRKPSLRIKHRRAIRRGDNRDRFSRTFHVDYAPTVSIQGGSPSSVEGLTQSTGGDTCYYFTHSLYDVYTLVDPTSGTSIPGLSQYGSLYDQFKLCAVKLTFKSRVDATVATTSVPNITSDPIISIIDSDGQSSTTTSYITAVNDGRAKRHKCRGQWSVYYKPKILIPTLVTSTSTTLISGNNIAMPAQYESTFGSSTLANNTQHFGLLVVIPKGSATMYWDISCVYYISMKHRLS